MKIANATHRARPWRIHEIAHDLRLLDVWELPTPGGPDDFPRLIAWAVGMDPGKSSSATSRLLWQVRWKLGALLRLEEPPEGAGFAVDLRGRLPADLRDPGPDLMGGMFEGLYLTKDEYAAEIVNRTVQGVMHLGWVRGGDGTYHGEMAVYVRPNGLLGSAYLALIDPFRHLVVYPAMLRQIDREWQRA